MAEILNNEELRDRARDLVSLNGFDLVFVDLDIDPPNAVLTAEFLNDVALADLLAAVAGGTSPNQLFSIIGGQRRLGGTLPGQVQVTNISEGMGNALVLTIAPIGDYSTYQLRALHPDFDPIFATIDFKFRPGCFNLNCRSTPGDNPPSGEIPKIDYLSRDYHSFKHVLIGAMMERVPGWQPTSEADLDQVIINLLAARGDELADKQDRVGNEAYFARARQRLSLARHARLMDYHIHQGNQASTWIALHVTAAFDLPANFSGWTGRNQRGAVFIHDTRDLNSPSLRPLHPDLNALALYTWDNLVSALEIGSTEADLSLPGVTMTPAQATDLRELLLSLDTPLLLEEALNPDTGAVAGRDQRQRQLLHITDAQVRFDPNAGASMVRISWADDDALATRFCFVTRCPGQSALEGVSQFHGNLAPVTHGEPNLTLFTDPNRLLDVALESALDAERTNFEIAFPFGRITETSYTDTPWGRLCPLPESPLSYRDTPPGGEVAALSSTEVSVEGVPDWSEQIDLIQSLESANHYVVQTDELERSTVRFGRPPNGEAPPPGSFVAVRYQTGIGSEGNVGADTLVGFDAGMFPAITRVWNPFDVTNGRLPETPNVIRRRAPHAYRARQLRAVTLGDYRKRAEELLFVQRAAAAYAWSGSWRTVRITLDPIGSTTLQDDQIAEATRYLNQVRLIGEDIEIRPPVFVPLDVHLLVCAKPSFWQEDLRLDLEEAFTEGYTGSGEKGFFHSDLWTFGQSLYASQIIGRALAVEGVDRVLEVGLQHWDRAGGPTTQTLVIDPQSLEVPGDTQIDVSANEIIRVANDPNALEFGRMEIFVQGGRR